MFRIAAGFSASNAVGVKEQRRIIRASRETLLNRDMLLASDTESCGTFMPGATATALE
jgi:hypothetical protein